MAQIPIPPLQAVNIPYPELPQDPPTLQDVHNAYIFRSRVEARRMEPRMDANANVVPSTADVSAAQVYYHKIVHAVANPVPPAAWMQAIQEAVQQAVQEAVQEAVPQAVAAAIQPLHGQINGLQGQINAIQIQLNAMEAQLNTINGRLIDASEIAIRAYNRGCGDGAELPYKIIPIRQANNVTVTPDQLQLPLLTNAEAVNNLEPAQLLSYLQHYRIPHADNPSQATRVLRVKSFIGCNWPL